MTAIRPLTESLQKVAIEELNEVPERVTDDVAALRTWIQQQPHLNARTDEQFLVAFLRGCKFSLEKSKKKLDNYHTLKTKYPEFYTIENVDDPKVMEIIHLGVGLRLPTPLNDNGPRIVIVRFGIYPPEKYTMENVMRVGHALQETSLWDDDYMTVHGLIVIIDMAGYSATHMLQMTPTVIKKMTIFAEDGVPIRQRATHMINVPSGFETAFNLLKPLMPAKQQERLYVHGSDLESLYRHIPKKYLPQEYGGENGSIPEIIEVSEKQFLQYRDYFIEDVKYRNKEELRLSKNIDFENVFGTDGSFRKLNVD